ncbi:peptide alpha-N-acetyltransferase subunit NAT5 Ecym_2375 [Eremothecium cymbalariae DBVPG|uniref:N-acetyltransferase domain-containing protein n=1 Tax=Eremothecium cymbalariae (strain CBS 270.75 / DBVPG 7215 / KCTC 17166 / NRRL Y-17582) TaxID=931890 RepID=G8JNP0_ERECY|nr:Hypothetical protein Ecym_2375 [Eremothecium cymbalariae DBVPG\
MSRDIISVDDVYLNTLGTFITIVNSASPIPHSDSFFNELFESKCETKPATFISQLAYYGEIAVGCVKAKLITDKISKTELPGVHIETLDVLKAYRGKGVGSKLLEYVENRCKQYHQSELYTYVPSNNEGAVEWYLKHGFKLNNDRVQGYYEETAESLDAYLLMKRL